MCISCKYEGETLELSPVGADAIEKCEAVFEEMPGWTETTWLFKAGMSCHKIS
ncbi:MAG TPA: hypothetical protein ENJ08_10895 [Gammaproteobacteria bacterium]|nr:hypothetical protein [Gammaproteobacteria bacterium]